MKIKDGTCKSEIIRIDGTKNNNRQPVPIRREKRILRRRVQLEELSDSFPTMRATSWKNQDREKLKRDSVISDPYTNFKLMIVAVLFD